MKVKKIEIKKYFVDSPDIDCDFEPYGRDLVKDYLKNKYGHDKELPIISLYLNQLLIINIEENEKN